MRRPSTEPTTPSITSSSPSMRAYAPIGTWQPPSSLRMTTRSAVTHVIVSAWLILAHDVDHELVVLADLDADRALAHRRDHLLGVDVVGDAVGPAHAGDAGGGEDDRVDLAVLGLAHAGVEVAAHVDDLEVGAQRAHLAAAAKRARAQLAALRAATRGRSRRRRRSRRAGRPARASRAITSPSGSSVGTSFIECTARSTVPGDELDLDLLGEQALAAHLGQRHVEDLVAGGLDDLELDRQPGDLLQQPLDVLRLPQGELAAPGADDELVAAQKPTVSPISFFCCGAAFSPLPRMLLIRPHAVRVLALGIAVEPVEVARGSRRTRSRPSRRRRS